LKKGLIFILLFFCFIFPSFSKDKNISYEHSVNIGWIIPDAAHLSFSVYWAYFGVNIFGAREDTKIEVSRFVSNGTEASIRKDNYIDKGKSSRFQFPIGFRYFFGKHTAKFRVGVKAAWVPTLSIVMSPFFNYADLPNGGLPTTELSGETFYWDENSQLYIRHPVSSEEERRFESWYELGVSFTLFNVFTGSFFVLLGPKDPYVNDGIRYNFGVSIGYSFLRRDLKK